MCLVMMMTMFMIMMIIIIHHIPGKSKESYLKGRNFRVFGGFDRISKMDQKFKKLPTSPRLKREWS